MSSTPKITTTVGSHPSELHPLAVDWLHALGALHWNSSLHGKALSLVENKAVQLTTVQPGMVSGQSVTGSVIDEFELRLAGHDIRNAAELMDACFRAVDRSEPVERQARHWLADIRLRTWLRPTPRELSAATCTCIAPEPDCLHLLALGYAVVAHLDADPRSLLRLRGLDLNLWPAALRPITPSTADRQPSTSQAASDAHSCGHVLPLTEAADAPTPHDEQAEEADDASVAEPVPSSLPLGRVEPTSHQAAPSSTRLASAARAAARLLAGQPVRITAVLHSADADPVGTRSKQDLAHSVGVDAAAAYSAWLAHPTVTVTPASEEASLTPIAPMPKGSAPAEVPMLADSHTPGANERSASFAMRGAVASTGRCFWEVDYWILRIDASEAHLEGAPFLVPEPFAKQARIRRHQPFSLLTSLGHVSIAWGRDGFAGRIIADDGHPRGIREGDHLFLLANPSGLKANVLPSSKPTADNDDAPFGATALRLTGHSGPVPETEADVWTILATRLGALDPELLSSDEIRTILQTRGDNDILAALDRPLHTAQSTARLPQHSQTVQCGIGTSGTDVKTRLIALMGTARYRAANKHIRAGRVSRLRTTEDWTTGCFTTPGPSLEVKVAMSDSELFGICPCPMPHPCTHVDAVALHAVFSATGIKTTTRPNRGRPTAHPQPRTAGADTADTRLAALVGRPRARSAKEHMQRWRLTGLKVSANTASAFLCGERVSCDVRIVITRGQLTGTCDCWTFSDLRKPCLHMDVLTLHALDQGIKVL